MPEEASANANSFDHAWDTFVQFLRQRRLRVTESRRIILERTLLRPDHFRADDLASELATGDSRVSRGTVYRTLALLLEAGLLREVRDSDTHVHYESIWKTPHHEHMICDRCGSFTEFSDERISRYLHTACIKHDFEQRCHRVVIFGTCAKCRESVTPSKEQP